MKFVSRELFSIPKCFSLVKLKFDFFHDSYFHVYSRHLQGFFLLFWREKRFWNALHEIHLLLSPWHPFRSRKNFSYFVENFTGAQSSETLNWKQALDFAHQKCFDKSLSVNCSNFSRVSIFGTSIIFKLH